VKFHRALGIEAVGLVAESPGGEFQEGDVVATCMGGMGREFDGGYAEYTCVPASQVVALYRARLRNSSITAVVDRCRAKYLHCHEGELRQIILNIVGNAVDEMKHGGVLSLRCRESTNWANGEAGVRIIIADNGTGMDREVLSKIFEPFFSTKGIGGTGLGMWVTEDLVKKTVGLSSFVAQRALANMELHSVCSFRMRRRPPQPSFTTSSVSSKDKRRRPNEC
jgi:hypothetical protein